MRVLEIIQGFRYQNVEGCRLGISEVSAQPPGTNRSFGFIFEY